MSQQSSSAARRKGDSSEAFGTVVSSSGMSYSPILELGEGGMGKVFLARAKGAGGFTKLVVHDLEKQLAFYCNAYGLHAVRRVREHIGDEAIEEVMLATEPDAPFGTFVLLKYLGRPPSPTGESSA